MHAALYKKLYSGAAVRQPPFPASGGMYGSQGPLPDPSLPPVAFSLWFISVSFLPRP